MTEMTKKDRPIFDELYRTLWRVYWIHYKGGVKAAREEEKLEIARLRKAKEDKAKRNMEFFDEMIRRS